MMNSTYLSKTLRHALLILIPLLILGLSGMGIVGSLSISPRLQESERKGERANEFTSEQLATMYQSPSNKERLVILIESERSLQKHLYGSFASIQKVFVGFAALGLVQLVCTFLMLRSRRRI